MTNSVTSVDRSREVLATGHPCTADAKDVLSSEAVHAINGPLATALLSVQLAVKLLPEQCDMRVERHLNRVADCIRFASSVAQGFNASNERGECDDLMLEQEGRTPVGTLTNKKEQVTQLEFALANFLSDVLALRPAKCTASTTEAAGSFSVRIVIDNNSPAVSGSTTTSSPDAYNSAYAFLIAGLSHLSSFTAASEVDEQHRVVVSICIQR